MRKVIQITDEAGNPVSGHIFEAPDETTLLESMKGLPTGCWHEVASEAELVVPEILSDTQSVPVEPAD